MLTKKQARRYMQLIRYQNLRPRLSEYLIEILTYPNAYSGVGFEFLLKLGLIYYEQYEYKLTPLGGWYLKNNDKLPTLKEVPDIWIPYAD